MTAKRQSIELTKEERLELDALFRQIKISMTSSSIPELERFTDLFTRALSGKGSDTPTS